ncbi:hypothetical protein HYH02_001433 [Chlamydomonas schloesseri]|uniref:Uncharacterized protein n=1 Tax=Chlamydomonas schloesseri TaxID=2026947 RepID=A0A835WVY3_9CHLO|nr:hypothetical protein HYH02_001433 [Chlamydomonas schloesseri]|eukprot:KAG2454412.1 hypothetical protein HYH02_001433 [Chlamydomonas schloesseri]
MSATANPGPPAGDPQPDPFYLAFEDFLVDALRRVVQEALSRNVIQLPFNGEAARQVLQAALGGAAQSAIPKFLTACGIRLWGRKEKTHQEKEQQQNPPSGQQQEQRDLQGWFEMMEVQKELTAALLAVDWDGLKAQVAPVVEALIAAQSAGEDAAAAARARQLLGLLMRKLLLEPVCRRALPLCLVNLATGQLAPRIFGGLVYVLDFCGTAFGSGWAAKLAALLSQPGKDRDVTRKLQAVLRQAAEPVTRQLLTDGRLDMSALVRPALHYLVQHVVLPWAGRASGLGGPLVDALLGPVVDILFQKGTSDAAWAVLCGALDTALGALEQVPGFKPHETREQFMKHENVCLGAQAVVVLGGGAAMLALAPATLSVGLVAAASGAMAASVLAVRMGVGWLLQHR